MWDLEASLSTCVPYSYKKKRQLSIAAGNVTLPSLLNLRSHSSAPASCKFFAVEPYSTCSYLVTSLVCSFFLFYWIFRSYTLCGFLLDWGAFWQWATQHFVPPDSQLYLGNTCVRDLLLASSRPVIRAFWNSVARAEDLLETNTSLLWETDIVIVGIFGTVSSCDHHCNCLVVELGACACEAFSLATDVLVDFFFPVNESTLLYSVLALLLRALYVMSTR